MRGPDMKENGAMKEDGAAKLSLLQALSEMCGRCAPGTAIILIYNILLGRDPDPDGEAFYGARLDGPPEQRLGALRELATSDEARRYGLFSLSADIAEIDVGAVHLPEEPLGVLAVLGLNRRSDHRSEGPAPQYRKPRPPPPSGRGPMVRQRL